MPEKTPDSADKKTRLWRRTVLAAVGALGLLVLGVVTVNVVPWGLGGVRQIVPYLCFSHARGTLCSPGGASAVAVVTNDAGAAHSGSFPSWVIVRHWWGKEVVARGYLKESEGPVPLVWTSETSFRLTFAKQRYGDDEEVVEVQLRP
jgi:hypothetical protein